MRAATSRDRLQGGAAPLSHTTAEKSRTIQQLHQQQVQGRGAALPTKDTPTTTEKRAAARREDPLTIEAYNTIVK